MKIEIKREDLASLIYLTDVCLKNKDTIIEKVKLINKLEEIKLLIKQYDEKMEEKDIGKNWKQQKLF